MCVCRVVISGFVKFSLLSGPLVSDTLHHIYHLILPPLHTHTHIYTCLLSAVKPHEVKCIKFFCFFFLFKSGGVEFLRLPVGKVPNVGSCVCERGVATVSERSEVKRRFHFQESAYLSSLL